MVERALAVGWQPQRTDVGSKAGWHSSTSSLSGDRLQITHLGTIASDWRPADPNAFLLLFKSGARGSASTQSSNLTMARDQYLAAFQDVTREKPQADISELVAGEDRLWRLTFFVPSALANDVDAMLDIEDALHKFVWKNTPDLAGFFSLQFASNGQP